MLPIVYTTRIDDIPILKDKSLDNLDLKDIENNIIRQSKPQFKQTEDLIKSECLDIDDITEHESIKSMSPIPDNLYYCKYIRGLLKVPRKRSYNPVLLCKNPDFNTRLRRLSAGFLSIKTNCKFLKTLKPLTIDLNKAFERELVNGTLYVPKDVDIIGTCSNVNTKNHTTLVPTAMHVQSLIDNSQPFSEDLYSSMIYKIPSKNKNILTEKESNNITLLQYNSATTQVEKEISFDESEKINKVVKQAPNMSAINSSTVDSVLVNYLNNLNKSSTDQNITDTKINHDPITSNDDRLLPENNDTKDVALGPSIVSDDVFNKQYKSDNQALIECNNDHLNNLIKKSTEENITDKQTIDNPMTSNDNELVAQIPDNNCINDTIMALAPSTVSDDVHNKQFMGDNHGPIECNNDNNQKNIISNDVEHQFGDVTIASEATVITESSTKKQDTQPMVTVNKGKKEKDKLKGSSKRLKATNTSTPWYVHVPKKINFLEEDRLLTECSLKRMLAALNAIECELPKKKQMPQLNSKSKPKKNKTRPRAKPKQNSTYESKEFFCCWTKMVNSKSECQKNNLGIHPCGTDFSKCICCCKYSYKEANRGKNIQTTLDKGETTSSVNTESKVGDINDITTIENMPSPKIRVWAGYLPTSTENLNASETINIIDDCDSNITSSENNINAVINNIIGNVAIESNNGIISIDGSIYNNCSPNYATLVKKPPQLNANPEINTTCTTFNSSYLQNTQSIESIDSGTNLFIMKPITTEKNPIKLSENKILLTTANLDNFESKKSSPSNLNAVENKEQAPGINIDVNLKPSSNEAVTYNFNVTNNSDVSLTPIVQENLLPNNINNETNLISDIVFDINNSDLTDAAVVTSNKKCDLESENSTNANETQNEVGATIECLPATVENNKKSILSDLMEMAGISAADTTYDNAIIEPAQTVNVTDPTTMLNVPTLSPVTTLSELKWAVLHKAKFYSLNTKTGGLASIAIEIVKKCNNAAIVVSDDDDEHNYVKKNQKNFKRVYLKKCKELPVMSSKPCILKRRLFANSVSNKRPKTRSSDNNVIDLDSSDDEKSKTVRMNLRPKPRHTITKIIKHNENLGNASSDGNYFEISLKENNVIAKEIPEYNESAQITLNPKRVRESPMAEQTKNAESDVSSDDEPLSKKVRVKTPVLINIELDPSTDQQLEPEVGVDVIQPPEVEDEEDFILGV